SRGRRGPVRRRGPSPRWCASPHLRAPFSHGIPIAWSGNGSRERDGYPRCMRAWLLTDTTGIDALRLEEVDTPEPGPGEVRIELRASGLNHLDLWETGRAACRARA